MLGKRHSMIRDQRRLLTIFKAMEVLLPWYLGLWE